MGVVIRGITKSRVDDTTAQSLLWKREKVGLLLKEKELSQRQHEKNFGLIVKRGGEKGNVCVVICLYFFSKNDTWKTFWSLCSYWSTYILVMQRCM